MTEHEQEERLQEKEVIDPEMIRVGIILFLIFLLFAIIGLQLWNIQVNSNAEHKERAVRQKVRKIRMPAVRGWILDSDGTVVAGNRVSYDLVFHLSEMRMPKRSKTLDKVMSVADRAATIIGRKNLLTPELISRHMNLYPGIPMSVFTDLNPRELGLVMEYTSIEEGLEVLANPVRSYPMKSFASHLIGYVGPSDSSGAADRKEFFYYVPDLSGRAGLEAVYNDMLCGSPGKKLVMVNSRGFVHQLLEPPIPAKNGHDLILTLDTKAQKIAESLLLNRRGSIIVLDASNGAVLAMASSPGYDLEKFIPSIQREDYQLLLDDPGRPFLNRSTMGSYMPGSIIKPLDALALLENGVNHEEEIVCDGATPVPHRKPIHCAAWRIGGHGALNLEGAIKKSCNDYFIEQIMKLGITKYSKLLASAGLGNKTGFELNERTGLIPPESDPSWAVSETAYTAIGQGRIEVTPLQAVVYTAALANGGTLYRPYVVDRIVDTDGNVIQQTKPLVNGQLAASKQSIALVVSGMARVVNEQGGSAMQAKSRRIKLHGKTGTAQVGPATARSQNTWFIAFGTDSQSGKTYAIVVMVEFGSSGGGTCAPLARDFFDRWLPPLPLPSSRP